MNEGQTPSRRPAATARRVDQLCDDFEKRFRSGQPLPIEAYLAGVQPADKARVLAELLPLELELQIEQGERPDPAEYRRRFPDAIELVEQAFADTEATRSTARLVDAGPSLSTVAPHRRSPASTTLPKSPSTGGTNTEGFPRDLGDFELLKELGRGGMGVVYKARQKSLDRVVALKTITSGEWASHEDLRRFEVEARLAAQLDHPHIVPVHEVGQIGGLHYLAMGYVNGVNLDQWMKKGNRSPQAVASIMETVCEAVEHAHAQGIIHRDLKPANLLIDVRGQVRVTDFGIARRIQADSSLTSTGQILGTPCFMPPEQARGALDEIGPVSDVYSLGATLYCLLTGRPPFLGASAIDTLLLVLNQEPIPPRQVNPKTPADLETICLKCLEKRAADRYPSARAVAEELQRYLEHRPIAARPVTRRERAWRWCRRNPVVSSLLALSVLLMAVLGVGAGVARVREQGLQQETERLAGAEQAQKRRADLNETRAEQGRGEIERQSRIVEEKTLLAQSKAEEAQRAEASRERLAYVAVVRRAQHELEQKNAVAATDLLTQARWDLRGWEHDYLWTLMHGSVSLSGHAAPVELVAFDPTGSFVASRNVHQTIRVWNRETRAEAGIIPRAEARGRKVLALSRGSRYVISSHGGGVGIWATEKGELVRELAGVSAAAMHPKSNVLYGGLADGSLLLVDLDSQEPPTTHPAHQASITHVRLDPTGARLLTVGADGAVKAWETDPLRELRRHAVQGALLDTAADAEHWLTAEGDTLRLWDSEGKDVSSLTAPVPDVPRLVQAQTRMGMRMIALGPDGQQIAIGLRPAAGGPVGPIRAVAVLDARSGRLLDTLTGHADQILSIQYGDDGALATAAADNETRIWRTAPDDRSWRVAGRPGEEGFPAFLEFSADGSRVAAFGGGRVELWRALSATPLWSSPISSEKVRSARFSSDGKNIVVGVGERDVVTLDCAEGRTTATRSLPDGVGLVAVSPSDQGAAVSLSNGNLALWDFRSGKARAELPVKAADNAVAFFSHDGRRLATATKESFISIFDAESGNRTDAGTRHAGGLVSVAFSPDGDRLVTAGVDLTARVYDASTGEERFVLRGHVHEMNSGPSAPRPAIYSAEFSPDGSRIATIGSDETLRIWDSETGVETLLLKAPRPPANRLKFLAGGSHLAAFSRAGVARMWSADSPQDRFALRGHATGVTAASFHPDADRLATVSKDAVKVWELKGGTPIAEFQIPGQSLWCAQFHPSGKTLIGAFAQSIAVWNLEDGSLMRSWEAQGSAVTTLAFDRSGKRLLTGGVDGVARIWDFEREVLLRELKGQRSAITAAVFSPDESLVASGSAGQGGELIVWRTEDGQEVARDRPDTTGTFGVAFDPDSSRVFYGSGATWKLCAWDLGAGERTHDVRLAGRTERVAFSPDGNLLFVGGGVGYVTVLDAKTLRPVADCSGRHFADLTALALSRDGRWMATTGLDTFVVLHDLRRMKALAGGDDELPPSGATAPQTRRALRGN